MNHDFICYIIISTIKIPYRLKNNFRYNYTVILYNNIIFRFSFQIRRSDEHTPRAVGVRKYIIFLSQIPRCGFVTQRVFVCVCISSFFSRVSIFHRANTRDEHDPRCVIASRYSFFLFSSKFSFALFSRSCFREKANLVIGDDRGGRLEYPASFVPRTQFFLSFYFFFLS